MGERSIRVRLGSQCLEVLESGRMVRTYPVSTSARGAGEIEGSGMTPRGLHEIVAKFGEGAPRGAVFVSRQLTGEIYTLDLARARPDRDWILSRVLWLGGLEPGRNQGGGVDSQNRYIYIHGTAEEDRIGQPASHGCIRMRNDDVIELFDLVADGTRVEITA